MSVKFKLRWPSAVIGAACVAIVTSACLALPWRLRAHPNHHLLILQEDFAPGTLDRWQMPYPEDWVIVAEDGFHYLHMVRARSAGVPRRPLQFARLKNVRVGSFDLTARVRRQQGSIIVVFNYVDTLHFYYAHLSRDSGAVQPVHNGIFLVDGAPRRRIAGVHAAPALPDHSWHTVRLVRNVRSGLIQVFMDGKTHPLFSVIDHTFKCGQIGIGSFDEKGDFARLRLRSADAGCSE